MKNKVFTAFVLSILGLPSFAFFDGNVSKQYFFDKIHTIMNEETIDNSIKTEKYWTQNVLHHNRYRPVFMLSNKELYNLMPKENVSVSERISTPSIYNISLKNSSIIKVSLSPKNATKQVNKTTKKVDNAEFVSLYENAKNPNAEIEEKINTAALLKDTNSLENYNMALDLLNDVTTKETFNAYAFYLKGELFAKKNDSENAMKNYVESLKINPTNKQCFASIAKILEPTNKLLAQKYYEKAK